MKQTYLKNIAMKYAQREKESIDSQLVYDPNINIVSRNESYTDKTELHKVISSDCIQYIDDSDALHDYLKREDDHIRSTDNNESGIRLYRGQERASWICRSTLLRDYRDYFSRLDQDITSSEFYIFLQHNLQLLDKMLSPKHLYRKTFLEGLEKKPIKINEYIEKMKARMLKACTDLSLEINAARREIIAQHYGLPTALIDFTKDPYIALYFATEKYEEQSPIIVDHESLKDYFNIIYFNTNNYIYNWELRRDESMKILINGTVDEIIKKGLELSSKNYLVNDDSSRLYDNDFPVYLDQTSTGRPIENIRIKKQKGVLLSLGKYSHKCLEDAFKICSKNDKMPKLHLTLIHHNLIAEIRNILNKKNITREYLGFV